MSTISDKPAILYLNKQQFICKDRQKSFTAETTEVGKYSKIQKLAPLIKLSKENTSKK